MILANRYSLHKDWPHQLAVFLLIAAVYVWSMPRSVVLEDDGYFIMAAYFNAVTHPPGYPLFVFISHFFTFLPIGSVAFRVHLASACFGALACVVLWMVMRHLLEERIYAYLAALGLGLSATFWSQAIIAEDYTLNVLLFLILFVLALRCNSAGEGECSVYTKWMAFIYGLALSNHWPLLVLSTPALLVLLWPVRGYLIRHWHVMISLVMLGLLPYAWLVWRSHVVPEVSFYGPIRSWHDFWFFISRKAYAGVDQNVTAGWKDKWLFAVYALTETARQLGWSGICFTLAGFIWQWFKCPRRLALSLTLGYMGSTFLLILLLGFDYDVFHQNTFGRYLLISFLMAVVWTALGMKFLSGRIAAYTGNLVRKEFILYALSVLIIGGALIANIPHNLRSNDFLAADYAHAVLNSLEPNAIYYSNSDNIDGPIEYMNKIEKFRPDVTVFTGRYFIIDGMLYRPYSFKAGALKDFFNRFINHTDRPIYYLNDFPNDFTGIRYGFYTKVDKTKSSGGEQLVIRPDFLNLLSQWRTRYRLENSWDRWHYNLVLADFCELILDAESSRNEPSSGALADAEKFTCANFQGTLKRLKFALNGSTADEAYFDSAFDLAEKQKNQAMTKEDLANLYYYHGMADLRFNNIPAAQTHFRRSLDLWPHPGNPSKTMLMNFNK
jgi:hypothetical protein